MSDPASQHIELNGVAHPLPAAARDGLSVKALLASLDLGARRVAVEVNGEIVPRATHAQALVRAGDRVEIVTFVGGG